MGATRPPTSASSRDHLALVGATIHAAPAEEPIPDGVVLIEGGKIAATGPRSSVELPSDFQRLDCTGCTLTAGFWNSHVHFFERKWANAATLPAPELSRQLEDMLTRYGFTSVFDTGSTWDNTRALRDRVESGEIPGPRIRSTGEALIAQGAAPPDVVLRLMGLMPAFRPRDRRRRGSRGRHEKAPRRRRRRHQAPPAGASVATLSLSRERHGGRRRRSPSLRATGLRAPEYRSGRARRRFALESMSSAIRRLSPAPGTTRSSRTSGNAASRSPPPSPSGSSS